MTLTELYKGASLETLNMILEAQGKDFQFVKEGEEIKWEKKREKPTKE